MTREILRILISPRFLLGLALLGAVVLLCLAACGPGADRTPKPSLKISSPHDGAFIVDQDRTRYVPDIGTALRYSSKTLPIREFHYDGGKWCDVYADARGLHWKDCKTGKAPLSWVSISGDQLQVLNQVIEDIARIEARLKMLENPPPAYRADPSWNVYVGPIEDVPHSVPCDDPQVGDVLAYDAKTGKPLCRAEAPKGGKP